MPIYRTTLPSNCAIYNPRPRRFVTMICRASGRPDREKNARYFLARVSRNGRIANRRFRLNGTGRLYSCSLWSDKPTGRNNAAPRRLSRAGHNETKAQSEAPFLCVTHWFLSYRASVSDTPYLVGCNGVRRLRYNITCHVQRQFGNLDYSVCYTVATTL